MGKTIYIGLNDNLHDPSIAMMDDQGNLLFAESSERYLQFKRAIGCPADPDIRMEEIITKYLPAEKIDKVIICYSWTKYFHLKVKVYSVINHFINSNRKKFPEAEMITARYAAAANQNGAGAIRAFKKKFPGIIVEKRYFIHHLSHIANAIDSTHLKNGIGLVIDGQGENSSYSVYKISNGEIKLVKVIRDLFSLGNLYSAFTELSGFSDIKGEQWKVMGLSPYGEGKNKLLDYIVTISSINKKNGNPNISRKNLSAVSDYIKSNQISSEEVAFAGQTIFEEIFLGLIERINSLVPNQKNIFISGGCALNTLAIGKLHDKKIYENIIVPNAPADDGNSIGAVTLGFYQDKKQWPHKKEKFRNPYSGSSIDEITLEKYIETSGLPFRKCEDAAKYAAELLNRNQIIGWIQGRAEFGPRALGNRSILAHPGYSENKDRLNAVVKFRESFRPFAPSVLHEFGEEYFEDYCFTPYMEKTLRVKAVKKEIVPAVTHLNGTARLQSVTTDFNARYHSLILNFYKLSSIPMVINTSYNVMGKPIVHDLNDVMSVYLNSKIDAVFIGDYVLERS